MCEDPNVWYTYAGERVVGDISINTVPPSASVESETKLESVVKETVLIDLSTRVLED